MQNLKRDFVAKQEDIRLYAIDITRGVDEYRVVKELVHMFPKGTQMRMQAEAHMDNVQTKLSSDCYLYTQAVMDANDFYAEHKSDLPADWVPPKSAIDLIKHRIRLYFTD